MVSYSAHGEDLFVRGWLDEIGVERTSIRYFDIGGNHPSVLSNTFLFYKMGGSGVVVEPTPREADLLAAARPRDVLVRAGVAFDEQRSATLFQFEPSVYNTFDAAQAEDNFKTITELGYPIERRAAISVPLVPVMELAEQHFGDGPCHFLSIDVEGVDSLILQSIDWSRFRPWFICCERPDVAISAKILEAGYSLRCQVPHNAIFARDDVIIRQI
ncbi:methyltransferase, FkbM family [Devosia sp. YR412]|nr:methyltransferase, FkbM family [Devosia sp. YR412]